jgi:enediyne biosynthesis protein E4
MHPQLLHNDGTGRFENVSPIAGPYFEDLWIGRGAAGGDYDNDGYVDLVVTHLHRPVALLRNETRTHHHFIGFDLRTASRVPPWGGRIVAMAGDRKLVVPVVGAGSYLCHGDPRIVIGLGTWDGDVDVEVYWPSGHVDRFQELSVDRYWRIMEGARPVVQHVVSSPQETGDRP